MLVCALSLFFCVPLFASLVGNLSSHFHCHLTFIVISSAPLLRGVCVYHLNRCKTSLCYRGVWHSRPTTRNEAVDMSGKGNAAGFPYLLYIYYICMYVCKYVCTYVRTYVCM